VFGANLGEADGSFETKLDQLRSMGFPNDKRNASVLKGVGGDMTRAVESLIRLGEGSGPPAAPPKPSTSRSQPTSSPSKAEADDPWSMPNVSNAAGARPAKSYNPFDVPTTQPPATTGLENAFQNLQVAQPMSPHTTGGYVSHQMSNNMALTPLQTSHSYTNSPQPLSYNPFFQTASPTSQTAANPYYASHTAQSTPIQPTRSFSPGNPFTNSLSAQSTGTQQNVATFSQSRLAMPRHANTMPVFSSNTAASPSAASSMFFSQQPQLSPYQVTNTNAFDASANSHNYQNYSTDYQQPQYQQFQQQNPYAQFQQTAPQQAARADKNSILALYNLAPAAAPPMSTIPEQSQVPQMQQSVEHQNTAQASNSAATGYPTQSMFPTMLQSNSTGSSQGMQNNNPFMNATQQQQPQFQSQQPLQMQQHLQQQPTNPFAMMSKPTPAVPSNGLGIGMGVASANPYQQMTSQQPQPPQMNNFIPRAPIHMSKASVDINNLQNGRHSPDAFASLSARFA
jgi:hypothetical protein